MESHGKSSSLYKIHSAVVCFCESESKNRKLVGHNSENRPMPNLGHGKTLKGHEKGPGKS